MDFSFLFDLPTRIVFENSILSRAGEETKKLACGHRTLLVTDSGILRTGIADTVQSSLQQAGFDCMLFDRVEPNPKDVDCEEGGRAARDFNADMIVAVGGGSVIDSAKAIALLHTHNGKLTAYEGKGKVVNEVTPIVAIPTTAGTGSEVTRSAVITDTQRKFKMTIKDVRLAPRLALVDPETTYALPASLTATTGMDALVHAIEAYTCRLANPFSDALALAAMERIFPWLRAAVKDGSDKVARSQLMTGSLLAGVAFSHADVAAVHCLAEALGGIYDIPHGAGNSMFLPAVTAYNAQADPQRHARVAAACGLPVGGLSDVDASKLLVDALEKLSADINIPDFAGFPGVKEEDFPFLAEAAQKNGSTPSNCRAIGQENYLGILKACYSQG
ncbi:MAG: iron-containing alcohol dehydrogenase [Bacillota bacterium]|nr:iron-containing alcohol dehydrogenase [Bacillota bacterium]MDW7685170.1 iron-containing alcohol dehydrogenase [Bacillota bacterium]